MKAQAATATAFVRIISITLSGILFVITLVTPKLLFSVVLPEICQLAPWTFLITLTVNVKFKFRASSFIMSKTKPLYSIKDLFSLTFMICQGGFYKQSVLRELHFFGRELFTWNVIIGNVIPRKPWAMWGKSSSLNEGPSLGLQVPTPSSVGWEEEPFPKYSFPQVSPVSTFHDVQLSHTPSCISSVF